MIRLCYIESLLINLVHSKDIELTMYSDHINACLYHGGCVRITMIHRDFTEVRECSF